MYPNFVDFSAALPWVFSGIVAGLILSWFFNQLRRPAAPPPMPDPRELYKSELDALRSNNDRLQADYGHFQTALADAEARANLNVELKQKIAMLSNAELMSRNDVHAANQELEKLRNQMQANGARTSALQEDARRSQTELARLQELADAKNAELGQLKSDLQRASLAMQSQTDNRAQIDRYLADIDALKAEIVSRDQMIEDSKNSHSKIASELVRARDELSLANENAERNAALVPENISRDYDQALADLSAAYDQINTLERQVAELQTASLAENGDAVDADGSNSRPAPAASPPRTMYVSSGAAKPLRVAQGQGMSSPMTGSKRFRVRSSDMSLRSGMSELAELRAKVEALSEKTEELRELTLKGE